MLFITIPLSLLKTYTYLSYVSMAGIGCSLLAGLLLIGYLSNELATGHAVPGSVKVFDFGQFFGYMGIAMFAFEGNGIVINLKAEAQDKKRYPHLLRMSILTVIVWYMIIANIAYATYKGDAGLKDYIN